MVGILGMAAVIPRTLLPAPLQAVACILHLCSLPRAPHPASCTLMGWLLPLPPSVW
jgi:hypothetical protein